MGGYAARARRYEAAALAALLSSSVALEWQFRIILPPCGGIPPPAWREVVMKAIRWIIAAVALSFVEPTQAAQSDPEVIIYRFPGVLDNGGASNTGLATSFHCTNFSGAAENIRFVTRAGFGPLLTNVVFGIVHLGTLTVSTHETNLYADTGTVLNTGAVSQGTTAIAATSINIICTAVTLDASSPVPNGFALRGIRFNPVPGSQE